MRARARASGRRSQAQARAIVVCRIPGARPGRARVEDGFCPRLPVSPRPPAFVRVCRAGAVRDVQ
eukprot:11193551-Lingulodinium_polyedra.AAC.1